MNRTGWWIGGLLAFLLVIGAVFSWTPNRSPGPTGERTGLRQNAPSGQEISNRQGLPNTANRDMTEARKAAAAASNVSGVRTAHAFVKDRTAYIGIVPDTPMTNSTNSRELEERVAREVEKDSTIDRAVVTSDQTHVGRIRRVSEGLMSGKTMSQFDADVKDIVNRMQPMKR